MAEFQAYCMVSIAPVRSEASDRSEIVTQLLFGELITVLEVQEPWARIETFADAYSGYIDFKHFRPLSEKEVRRWMDGLGYLTYREAELETPWGLQRICRGSFIPEGESGFHIGKDAFQLRQPDSPSFSSPVAYAMDYLNTPYLWGGKSPFGIDCSGIVQVIYRLFGFNLPRDASEQVNHGSEVTFDEISAGDLAYFSKNGKVTHVGILDGKGGIIHAAGHVRLDRISPEGILKNGELTHHLSAIRHL